MSPVLDARAVAIGGRLQPTDLVIDTPQLVCLIGLNGSGKTSLLQAIAGVGGGQGSVRIAGEDPAGRSPDGRKRMLSYLPAGREASWPVTARDLVRLGLPSGEDGSAADIEMARLSLEAFANRRIDRLSTGERSRVLIARALAATPRLLLLDEPTANLDPRWRLRLMARLREAVDGGQAALVAMHDLDAAADWADRLVLMDGGRLVADGAPEAVMNSRALQEGFGIARVEGRWREFSPTVDPLSSP